MDDLRAGVFMLVVLLLMLLSVGIAVVLADFMETVESQHSSTWHTHPLPDGLTVTVIPALTQTLTATHSAEMTFTTPSEPVFIAPPTSEPLTSPGTSPEPALPDVVTIIQPGTDLTGRLLGLHSGQALVILMGFTHTQSQYTLADGTFRFLQLPPDVYSLRVNLTGYLPLDVVVPIGANGEPVHIEFELAVGDINGDGVIDMLDLVLLRQFYQSSADQAPPGADFDGDGVIGLGDLNLLAKNLRW